MARILYFVTDPDPIGIKLALEHKDSDVAICLLQDAVYFGCKGKNGEGMIAEAIRCGVPIFAASKDVELRGLRKFLHSRIKLLGYGEIIDLVTHCKQIINI